MKNNFKAVFGALYALAPVAYWLAATPAVLPLAGQYLLVPGWLVLGAAGWAVVTDCTGGLRCRFSSSIHVPGKWRNIWLWCCLLFWLAPTAMLGHMVLKTIGMAGGMAALTATAVLGLWMAWPWIKQGGSFRLPRWWKVIPVILVAWAVRTYLGTTDRPTAYVGWLPALVVFFIGSWFRVKGVLHAAAVVNLCLGAFLAEWYTTPLNGQVQRVIAQPGVMLIRHDPNLDFRWVREGCKPGKYWMGTRSMTGLGQDPTTVQLNKKGFKYGGSTADQGIVDCGLHLVMVGDFDDSGQLYVLDETDGRLLSKSRVNFRVHSGFTGITWHEGLAWLIGSYEADRMFVWLNLRNPKKPVQVNLPFHATHVVFCSHVKNPCFYSAVQQGDVRKHFGDGFKQTIAEKRHGRSLAPDMLLDEAKNRLYVSDVLTGLLEVFDAGTLKPLTWHKVPSGIRFMVIWPGNGLIWAANFMDGYLYEIDHGGHWRRLIFIGQKSRWLNLSRDEKSLLWCAASACYRYTPGT